MGEFPARIFTIAILSSILWLSTSVPNLGAQDRLANSSKSGTAALKTLSLEELSRIEVTTVSKESTEAFKTPAAIYVLSHEDIMRSGFTTIPDLLRLAPGVEVA